MPLSGLQNTTGTKAFVVVGEPATFDGPGFKALDATMQEVVGLVTFPEWGDNQNDVQEGVVGENRILHLNGANDGGEVSFPIQYRDTDAGRDLIKANSGVNTLMTVKKLWVNGDVELAVGIFTSPRHREAGQDGVRGSTHMLRVNSAVYEYTAAEWAAF